MLRRDWPRAGGSPVRHRDDAHPEGHGRLELAKYHTPPGPRGDPRAPASAPGIRHITFAVQGIDDVLDRLRAHGAELVGGLEQYEDSYRLCYVRGPEGVTIELGEQIK